MPDYTKWSTADLQVINSHHIVALLNIFEQKELDKYGVKPGTVDFMVFKLQQIWRIVNGQSEGTNSVAPSKITTASKGTL